MTEKSLILLKASYAASQIISIEEIWLFLRSHEDVWVAGKPRPQRRRSALWRANDEKIRLADQDVHWATTHAMRVAEEPTPRAVFAAPPTVAISKARCLPIAMSLITVAPRRGLLTPARLV